MALKNYDELRKIDVSEFTEKTRANNPIILNNLFILFSLPFLL